MKRQHENKTRTTRGKKVEIRNPAERTEHKKECPLPEKPARYDVPVSQGEFRETMLVMNTKIELGFADMNRSMDARFGKVDNRFVETDKKMETGFANMNRSMDARFGKVNNRFVETDKKIETGFADMNRSMDARFGEVNNRFVETDKKMETKFADMNRSMDARFGEVNNRFVETDKKMETGFADMRTEIKEAQNKMLRWMFATVLAAVGMVVPIVLGIIRYLS